MTLQEDNPMFGGYGNNRASLPRVLHLSIARYAPGLPQPGEALEFLVTIHEEGTGIGWQHNVVLGAEIEEALLADTQELTVRSQHPILAPEDVEATARRLGARLYEAFIGESGQPVLQRITPTAVLLDVDETILNLPWELLGKEGQMLALEAPLGRLVVTRILPRPGRDPLAEDTTVRILAVANPTLDLAASEAEVAVLESFRGDHDRFHVAVDVLPREAATRAGVATALEVGDYDILHFAGHGLLDPDQPEESCLQLTDGPLTASDVLGLRWRKPPSFVFNSACESGRAAPGRRLAGSGRQANGLPSAFLTVGVYGYAGYFWPVSEQGAAAFAQTFYQELFRRENVGLAFLEARRRVHRELHPRGDLTAYSAILFGDAASQHRRDLATAA
jgi:hypothetical protein